ncbi:MAG: VCBS repeat-containing protein, partial [Myxococcota bacterium]
QAQVVNQGCLGVGPGVAVTLRTADGQVLGRTTTQAPLPAGRVERVEITAEGLGNNFDLSVVVRGDDPGEFNECFEDNNDAAPVDVACRVEL